MWELIQDFPESKKMGLGDEEEEGSWIGNQTK
jgi:hypothetical protein